ncbi:hypothetical protein C8A05DRAFT_20093 [Staphylotrichum tortipilum]|uniref:Uncharacterized protein n=1 Tax=Staphylotrichum tortipilum TaxID=2831512 RepID=A0AAN6M9N4_9PEZI|nr:hypothetical protein C8A05DRAFT_20093 [Staphylotrichum longicolle]
MSDAINITNRLHLSTFIQSARAQSALSDGDANTMWQSAWSLAASINTRVASSPLPPNPALLDIDLHDLWHTYWHGAINTAPDSPKLDRLALQIIQAREQGVLTREQTSETSRVSLEAMASNGQRLWTDLPFLVEDMAAHWTNGCAEMSSAQRLSGAQFLALLAAAGGAVDDAICGVGLVVLREALETPRPLGTLGAADGDPGRQIGGMSVADLLPAANVWLFTAGWKLVRLSDGGWEGGDGVGLGELVTSGRYRWEVPRHGGFSPQRWMWWLRRLDEIASKVEDGNADELGGFGAFVKGMMDNMLHIAAQTNGPVGQAAQQAGGMVRHRPQVRVLGPARP